jgi:hypothetical protein
MERENFVGDPYGMLSLGRLRKIWENNCFKINLKTGREFEMWIKVTQVRVQW